MCVSILHRPLGEQRVFILRVKKKRCYEQPHLAKSWHRYSREKLNAGGQTSLFWLKCSIKTHLILLPGRGGKVESLGQPLPAVDKPVVRVLRLS